MYANRIKQSVLKIMEERFHQNRQHYQHSVELQLLLAAHEQAEEQKRQDHEKCKRGDSNGVEIHTVPLVQGAK